MRKEFRMGMGMEWLHTLGFVEGGARGHVAGSGSSAGEGERLAGEESEGGDSGGGELHFGGRF